MKFIALLRGINVGGNNKISMSELKKAFIQEGFADVTTYINSGNVIFTSEITDEIKLKTMCEKLIVESFNLNISVAIISSSALADALVHAPSWWNKGDNTRHNAIFVISPMTAAEVCEQAGEIRPEYEKLAHHGQVIFWSAPLDTFSRTHWGKISKNKELYRHLTIRNANTALKLAELTRDIS